MNTPKAVLVSISEARVLKVMTRSAMLGYFARKALNAWFPNSLTNVSSAVWEGACCAVCAM